MFDANVYKERRAKLKQKIGQGVIFIPGNSEAPMNYAANPYHFRQDSTFLYYFGVDLPDFFGIIDCDTDQDILFGYDFEIEDIVWMGPQKKLEYWADKSGCSQFYHIRQLKDYVKKHYNAGNIHYVPQYRAENVILLSELLGKNIQEIGEGTSVQLVRAIASQRELKDDLEVSEIEKALEISYETHTIAMKMARPGLFESDIVARMMEIVLKHNSYPSFPTILSVHGEILHNHFHSNQLTDGKLLIHDSGVESPEHYASDITRTFPVNGKFSPVQKDIYEIVLKAQLTAIQTMKPGVYFKDVHLEAARTIAEGLLDIGLLKNNVEDIVTVGAHALFFPHGLGHLLGLDVHDMENYGEENFGYDETVQRSDQFGLGYLRFARKLQPGHVITVEPGIYFIPELIKLWKQEKKFEEFIRYDRVEKYLNFGGIRIEDDILITDTGSRILGKPIPKTVEEVEATCSRYE
jgi:Xaa-Pro aminopeptidase